MFGFDNQSDDTQQAAGAPPVSEDTSSATADDAPANLPAPDTETTLPEEATQEPQEEPSTSQPSNDLTEIKNSALQELTPLVGHLEQTPEEKFKTTMMLIQATDDSSMIPTAYEAAKAIADEKTKAQALLDIVNEINYFTSQHDHEQN